ncbi:MAG: GGDEF domain-containing protein, partial [Gammaproteobacteria bacterium]
DKGEARGVLATFDDVSEVERQNVELEKLLNERKEAEKEIRRQNERLEYLATRDPLTDCLNRRALFEKFDQEIGHARDTDAPLACIMTDIDHFKSVNDTFGHSVGDDVIRLFADTLRACLRSIDIIGRYGGEEFCIVLPGLDLERAAQAAERIRAAIEREGVSALPPDAGRTLTSSFGVSLWHVTDKSGDDTVQRADEALYASKTGGRNRVTRTDELPSTATLTA